MNVAFYVGGVVAVIATLLMITRVSAVHALLYLNVSLLSVALIFYSLGAPFVALLEVIIYAGAIMVLFLFSMMMLNIGTISDEKERALMQPGTWRGPGILALILLAQLLYATLQPDALSAQGTPVEPRAVGAALFGPYMLGAELASTVLLAGLVGAHHLGRRLKPRQKGETS